MADWTATHSELMRAVIERLPRITWDRMISTPGGLETLVEKVMASIPDISIDPTDVGCGAQRGVWPCGGESPARRSTNSGVRGGSSVTQTEPSTHTPHFNSGLTAGPCRRCPK